MQNKEMKFLLYAKANDFINVSKILMKIDKSKTKGRLKNIVNINSKNSDGSTALHYASKNGNIEMLEELLLRGASIDACDNDGLRPLSYACANNHLNVVSKLVERGSKLNTAEENNSPIHIAARVGHRDVVKILMEKGADIHSQNKSHQSPVDVACENNHYGIVNVLLSASSKLIEEFSENSFKSIARKSLNPSLVRTTTLPAAITNGNAMDTDYLSWSKSFPNAKLYSNGSQDQICYSGCDYMQGFVAPPAKTSGSLNAIFLQDDENVNNEKTVRSSTLNNSKKVMPLEIVLPYPSKFSKSNVLKIKSPLLPLKRNQFNDSDHVYKGLLKDTICGEQHWAPIPNDQNQFPSKEITSANDYSNYKPNTMNGQKQHSSPRCSDATAQPSLSLQSRHGIMTSSPSPFFFSESRSADRTVSEKPPSYREMRTAQSYARKYHKRKDHTQSPMGTSPSSNFSNRLNDDNNGVSCHMWIKSIDLQMILDSLIKEGFDSFLALSLATDDELLILCNNRIDHLNILKIELARLKIPSINELMFSSDIQQILTQLGQEKYSNNFIKEGYFYVNHLPRITDKLLDRLEIIKIGHRRLLFECFKSLKENIPKPREQSVGNRSVSSLSQEMANVNVISPLEILETKDSRRNKCHSLPRFSLYRADPLKRSPPPIPPRSCSISNENDAKKFTLDDILTDSMYNDNLSPKKSDYCASRDKAGELSNLDDLLNMLTNLGRELETELTHSA